MLADKKCVEVDECSDPENAACGVNSDCREQVPGLDDSPGYECQCKPGYMKFNDSCGGKQYYM